MSETADKRKIQKLQRAIVDGLEDVKAVDIQVFNTEGLSPLFERVIVASGNTNRQTKALAASVRDAVRDAGFEKPRSEGEENGEWIIVDCGPAVVHIMQPTIRQYYRLEDIWGGKAVRLRGSEARVKAARAAAEKSNAASARQAQASQGTAESASATSKVARSPRVSNPDAPKTAPVRRARTGTTASAGTGAPRARRSKQAPMKVLKVGEPAKKSATKRGATTKKA